MFKNYKQESRKDWGTNQDSELLSIEQINLGAILRIADATEAMAKNRIAEKRRGEARIQHAPISVITLGKVV